MQANLILRAAMLPLLALWLVLVAGMGGQALAAPDDAVQLRPTGIVPGQYIVVFRDDVGFPRGLARALARQHGFALRHSYSFALKGFAARMPSHVAAALADDPDVLLVEPDLYAHALLHGNDFQTLPTGVDRVDADLNATDSTDVDIAIIDTGIDLGHPDLNVYSAVDCTKGPNCEKGGDGNDGNGHGSHVAGIAAALDNGIGVVGVAPGARLWGVKVLRDDGSGFFSDIIQGIDYVTAHADEIEVANMSLGGQGRLTSLRTAIQNSVAAGVVYVVAAGNSASDVYGPDGVFDTGDDFIPAAYPEVASISALGDTDGMAGGFGANTSYDSPDDTLATFSNFSRSVVAENPVASPGAAIDLAAPGVDITSTWMGGMYATISGTSMSSPHVAGAAALEIAANGRATNVAGVAVIRQTLIDAAEAQSAWGPSLADIGDPDTKPEGLLSVASGPPNHAPTVSISSPGDGATFASDATISFTGSASDAEDDDLTAADLDWTSSIDGLIGTGGSFDTIILSDGVHTISATVMDSGGKSGIAAISITVGTPPAALTVGVAAIDYATSGGRGGTKNLRITITLDELIEGASVSISLTSTSSGSWTGTGTTGSSGSVTFSLRNAPSDCYNTAVTDVGADGFEWDGDDGTSVDLGFCK